jgi:hypothetical protein
MVPTWRSLRPTADGSSQPERPSASGCLGDAPTSPAARPEQPLAAPGARAVLADLPRARGGICSRGRPGIPSRASDLVTMNVYRARSDSSWRVCCARVSRDTPLAFLDQVLHNASHNGRRNHTHPEGRRDRPVEAPATTRNFGQVLSPTARSWEMRSVAAAVTVRRADAPHRSQSRWGSLLPPIEVIEGGAGGGGGLGTRSGAGLFRTGRSARGLAGS